VARRGGGHLGPFMGTDASCDPQALVDLGYERLRRRRRRGSPLAATKPS
jgi:hypothetical protein